VIYVKIAIVRISAINIFEKWYAVYAVHSDCSQ